MPPGNCNNKKAPVRNKCIYCGKNSCKGERRHLSFINKTVYEVPIARVSFSDAAETSLISFSDAAETLGTIKNSGNTTNTHGESSQGIRRLIRREINSASPETVNINSSNATDNLFLSRAISYQPIQKTVVLQDHLNASSANTSSYQTNEKTVVLQDHLNTSSANTSSYQTNEKTVNLQDHLSGSVSNTSSYKTEEKATSEHIADAVACTSTFQASYKNDLYGRGEGGGDAISSIKKDIKNITGLELNENLGTEKKSFEHNGPIKANENELPILITQFSDINGEENMNNVKINNSSKCDVECQISANDKVNLKFSQKKKAVIYVGVVITLGSRTAKLRVHNSELKFVQLLVGKLLPSRNESAYAPDTDITSVLRLGDILTLVCTDHNRKGSGFHLFAHAGWKDDERIVQNNSNNNDAESVISFISHSSQPWSESQGSKAYMPRQRRAKKEIVKPNSNCLSDDIYQWLDQNESLHMNKNVSKISLLVEGSIYVGKVVELRLPFAFVVEVCCEMYLEYIFVLAKHFHPEGPNSQSLAQGVSVEDIVEVGNEINVLPFRSVVPKQGKFQWVARKAWFKEKGLKIEKSVIAGMQSTSKQMPSVCVEPHQLGDTGVYYSEIGNEYDGALLTLQSSWGLVKELGRASTYVFTRKNAFLFGLCLKNFVLDDVLQEGQLVKFSLEGGENGLMNAKVLYCGNPLPDFNSLEKAIYEYCQERRIKFCIENSLVKLGEELYMLK